MKQNKREQARECAVLRLEIIFKLQKANMSILPYCEV